jgi:hypothetical protein
MFQTKLVVKIETHFLFSNFFSRKSCLYEILWKNRVEPDRSQITVWRMCIACWLTLATDTHSEYVIHTAFPLQRWLHESSSLLRYTYIAYLVCFSVGLSESHQTMVTNTVFNNFTSILAHDTHVGP